MTKRVRTVHGWRNGLLQFVVMFNPLLFPLLLATYLLGRLPDGTDIEVQLDGATVGTFGLGWAVCVMWIVILAVVL